MKLHNPRTLIIDDEPDAREVLRTMIGRYCPYLEICGEADSVVAGLESIQRQRPALVFLDVDLHPGTGFDILDAFPNPDFKTVFTTAHDDFALKAYQYRAFHYLLKPIDPQDLVLVTEEIQHIGSTPNKADIPLQSLGLNTQGKIMLPTLQGICLVHADEISYAFAEEKYTQVILTTGEKIFVNHSLKELESLLPKDAFIRPHQSYIVRMEAVRKIQKIPGGLSLLLKDKAEIPVSRRNKDAVLRILAF